MGPGPSNQFYVRCANFNLAKASIRISSFLSSPCLSQNQGYTQLPVHLSNILQTEEDEGKLEPDELENPSSSRTSKRSSRERLLFVALILQSLVFLGFLLSSRRSSYAERANDSPRLYSPVTPLLREEIKVFSGGFQQRSIYQGVGEDVDQAWDELYGETTLRLPYSEAVQLPNKTWPIESDPGYYIAQLDVFHQLHCLNKLRKKLEDPGNAGPHAEHDHTSHCVDSLRQYIMCNIDISVVVWQWSEASKKVLPNLSYPHKCYNFEAIREYARANKIDGYINPDVFVDDGLPDPPVIHTT